MVNLLSYFRSGQQPAVAVPPRSASHPEMSLPKVYASNGFPVEAGLEWSLETTCHAIEKGPNYSTLSPDSTALCQGEIMERTQWWFSIVLKEEYSIKLFGAVIRISCLASVDQNNLRPQLI